MNANISEHELHAALDLPLRNWKALEIGHLIAQVYAGNACERHASASGAASVQE